MKTFNELKANESQLFSIDCLQIVSLSQTSESNIGRKYVCKTPNQSSKPIKWRLRRLRETNFKKLSDNYEEVRDERLFTKKRQILANIGPKDDKNCLNPIVITLYLDIFDERELRSVYNGSHLESLVLLQIESSEYILLSFDKICRPVPQLITDFSQYMLQFPQEFRELF